MNNASAKDFATGFITGFFDMLNTMLGGKSSFEIQDPIPWDQKAASDMEAQFGSILSASVAEGGALAVLLPCQDVYTIAAVFLSQEMQAKDRIAPEDAPTLREVFEPCLGAGASYFKEKLGKILTLSNIQVTAEGLATLPWGGQTAAVPFRYSAPSDISGSGVFVFAQKTVALVYPEAAASPDQAEVNNILSAVGMPPAPGASEAKAPPTHQNLDMILDIELTVKARLGRVEMPIGEILALGPGSIIDVGHLVDEPIELLVNDKLIARGDVVVVDEKFGLRITEIVSPKQRIESLR